MEDINCICIYLFNSISRANDGTWFTVMSSIYSPAFSFSLISIYTLDLSPYPFTFFSFRNFSTSLELFLFPFRVLLPSCWHHFPVPCTLLSYALGFTTCDRKIRSAYSPLPLSTCSNFVALSLKILLTTQSLYICNFGWITICLFLYIALAFVLPYLCSLTLLFCTQPSLFFAAFPVGYVRPFAGTLLCLWHFSSILIEYY